MSLGSQIVYTEGIERDRLAEFLSRDHNVTTTAIDPSDISVSLTLDRNVHILLSVVPNGTLSVATEGYR